jgi:hypothetical protein
VLDLNVVSKESSARSVVVAVTATAGQRFPPNQGPCPSHPGRPQFRRGRDPKPAGWETSRKATVFRSDLVGDQQGDPPHHDLKPPPPPATEETGHQHRRASPASGSTLPSPREAAIPVAGALRSEAARSSPPPS